MPRTRSLPAATSALTIVEVMISLAILVTALVSVMSGLFSLHRWQEVEHEEAVAQRTVQVLAERVMGANWNTLGAEDAPWSWHRREVPRLVRADGNPLDHYGVDWKDVALPLPESTYAVGNSPRYPPLQLGAVRAENDLVRLGLLDTGTAGSLRDLRIYLEYYAIEAFDAAGRVLILRGGHGLGTTGNGTIQWRVSYPAGNLAATEQAVDHGLPEDAGPTSSDHFNPSQDPLTGLRNDQPVLVRILATWTSSGGGPRRHELIFARRQ